MASQKIPPLPPGGKRLLRASDVKRKLNVSESTLWRLQTGDKRFPRPGRLRNRHVRVWTEQQIDDYAELLVNDVHWEAA